MGLLGLVFSYLGATPYTALLSSLLQHMASLMERREAQKRYINDSKLPPPTRVAVEARLNELPPELEEADWSDDIDGTKNDVIDAVKNLPG